MIDKAALLSDVLDRMLEENETITARAAVRRTGDVLKHASDVTRDPKRRALLEAAIARQARIRESIGRTTKRSAAQLELMLASKREDIERLEGELELLIASHKAMILAVSETGGFDAWRRFFFSYEQALGKLENLGAIPRLSGRPEQTVP